MNMFAILATSLIAQSWVSYSSKAENFSALFPGKVTTQSEKVVESGSNITVNSFIGKGETEACVLSAIAIPTTLAAADRKNLTAGIAVGFFKTSGFEKVSESAAKYNNFSGKYYKIKSAKVHGALWIIDRGNYVYTLTAASQAEDTSAVEKKFFGSFKLIK